jgi:dTMP kinase
MELVEQVNRLATGGLKPDLTIILDVDSEEGLRRARSTAKDVPSGEVDRIEAAGLDFHERVRRGYHAIAAAEPERCCVIEGDGTIDDIAARLRAAVLARFDL